MYLIVDTETTGLPRDWNAPPTNTRNWPRAVQVAWVLYDGAEQHLESASHIVQPDGYSIPKDAQYVHGITTERALAEGAPLPAVLSALHAAALQSQVVVAHNVNFDASVIAAECCRLGLDSPFRGKRFVCTMKDTTDYCRLPGRYGYKWPTLPELYYNLFGQPYREAHDAWTDAAACAQCFFELKRRGVVRC